MFFRDDVFVCESGFNNLRSNLFPWAEHIVKILLVYVALKANRLILVSGCMEIFVTWALGIYQL